MHLVEAQSRTAGLKIGKMHLFEHFFPLGDEFQYILVCTSTGMDSKNYGNYGIVCHFLKPILNKAGIKIVQVGGPQDERVPADIDLCGRTSLYQYNYLVKNASLVIAGDTSIIHSAGHYNVAIVSLFSISFPAISRAFFGEPSKQIYLTPEGDWSPSFLPQEPKKIINSIKPERVINASLSLLGLPSINLESIYIGDNYKVPALECIPDVVLGPEVFPNQLMHLRLDKGGTEENVYNQLRVRKCAIITDRPLDINALQFLRPHIEGLVCLVNGPESKGFIKQLHTALIPYRLVSFLSKEELQKIKLDYSEFNLLQRQQLFTKEDLTDGKKLNSKSSFLTSRKILSEGKIYLSYGHVEQKKNIDDAAKNMDNVIDIPSFWKDLDFNYIFNHE